MKKTAQKRTKFVTRRLRQFQKDGDGSNQKKTLLKRESSKLEKKRATNKKEHAVREGPALLVHVLSKNKKGRPRSGVHGVVPH